MLAKGYAVAAALSGREAASFARCLELLRAVGDPPELACARYAEAVRVLGNGSLLSTSARFYLERHPTTLPQITLAEAAVAMIELRRQAKASGPYLTDLRCRIGPFTKVLPVHPASVTTAAACAYALIVIVRKELGVTHSLATTLQLLGMSAFKKVPLHPLLSQHEPSDSHLDERNRLVVH